MSSLLAIAARELRLRWTLLPVALSLGVVPLLAPAFGFEFVEPQLVGLVLSLLMGAVAALLTGASVMGGDLGSGRLGFFFSRPLPWWAIWGGKLLTAVMLALGAGLLAAVPWMVWGRGGPLRLASLWDLQGAVIAVGWVLVLVGAGHAGSVALRSRSAWLLVDLVLLAMLVLLFRSTGELMTLALIALGGLRFLPHLLPLSLGVAILVASAAQMARGRSDIRRGHRALSVSLWPMLYGAIGGLLGLGYWVMNAKPEDLTRVALAQSAPNGSWIWIAGAARGRGGYYAAFLYDTASGRYVRLDRWRFLSFSLQGDRAVGLQLDSWARRAEGAFQAGRPSRPNTPARYRAPRSGPVERLGCKARFRAEWRPAGGR